MATVEEVAAEWDGAADAWDEEPMVHEFGRKALAILLDEIPCLGSERSASTAPALLDFGCGTGIMAVHLADHCSSITAVDISNKMVAVLDKKIAKASPALDHLRIWCGDFVNEPPSELRGMLYDVIFSGSVLTFCPDPGSVLRSLVKVLKPGGWMAHCVFALGESEACGDYSKGFSETELVQELSTIGLHDVSAKHKVCVGEAVWLVGIGRLPL